MDDSDMVTEVDCTTGQTTVRPMTDEEKAQRTEDQAAQAQAEADAQAAAQAQAAHIDTLKEAIAKIQAISADPNNSCHVLAGACLTILASLAPPGVIG